MKLPTSLCHLDFIEITISFMDESQKFPSRFISNQFVKYISEKEIEDITQKLADKISQDYQNEEVVLIGILKGSIIFMSDLVKRLKNVKAYIDFVELESIERTKENVGTIRVSFDISNNIANKNVIIVEEIIDTGRALHFFIEHLKLSRPKSIKIATLFDKPYQRNTKIEAEYIGKQIDDEFIVGHGLDLENYGRNVNDIYYLKYPN